MNNTHVVSINDRNTINITGVNKVENFDKEEFLLDTVMGLIAVKGEELEMIKLDTIEGNVIIKGKINALFYTETKKKNKNDSIVNRLFK